MKKNPLIQHSSTFGTIAGIILVIAGVVFYMFDILPVNFGKIAVMKLIDYSVIISFVIIGTKSYRDKVLDGTIAYNKAFLTGFLIIVFSSIINNFYKLILTTWIDPEYMGRVYTGLKNWMFDFLSNANLPDIYIDQQVELIEKQQAAYTPLTDFSAGITSSAFFGALLSLITAAFIKKDPDPFAESK